MMTGDARNPSKHEGNSVVSELDLAIVNALQYLPRGSWEPISRVLGKDISTLTRHWQALTDQGMAWVSCYPSLTGTVPGWVEISCSADRSAEVASTLAADPHAVTVAHTTGEWDLLVVVVATDDKAWSDYNLDRIRHIPGVLRTRPTPFSGTYVADGSHWRLDALSSAQVATLRRLQEQTDAEESRPVSHQARPIVAALAADGRLPASELGLAIDMHERAAQRRLAVLLKHREVTLRAEIAHAYSGWPVTVLFWAHAPAAALDYLASEIVKMRETRTCAVTASGNANLAFSAAFRHFRAIRKFESDLEGTLYRFGLRILRKAPVMRPVKLAGTLLDEAGHRHGVVPMAYWDPIPMAPNPSPISSHPQSS